MNMFILYWLLTSQHIINEIIASYPIDPDVWQAVKPIVYNYFGIIASDAAIVDSVTERPLILGEVLYNRNWVDSLQESYHESLRLERRLGLPLSEEHLRLRSIAYRILVKNNSLVSRKITERIIGRDLLED